MKITVRELAKQIREAKSIKDLLGKQPDKIEVVDGNVTLSEGKKIERT